MIQSESEQILILAPVGRDAHLAQRALREAGLQARAYQSFAGMHQALQQGVDVLLLTEEGLTPTVLNELAQVIRAQPAWSDLPIVLLVDRAGAVESAAVYQRLGTQASVILLERPVRPPALISIVQSLLQDRRRQYQVRDLLAHQSAQNELLQQEIEERKQVEASLQEARRDLKQRVNERTADLSLANQLLRQQINERVEAEDKLTEVRRRLAQSRENERAHLARELHDGPLQELSSVVFSLSFTQQQITEPGQAAALEEVKDRVTRVSNGLRMISNDLRPPILVDFGLIAAMRAHADRFQEMHPDLQLALLFADEGAQLLETLPEEVALSIYRIYQQALRNVVQHAKAEHVWVRTMFGDSIVLEIEDDGEGFEVPGHWVELARDGHIGVVGMVERADMVGGTLTIHSQLGVGTRVHVRIPAPLVSDGLLHIGARENGASPASDSPLPELPSQISTD